MNVISISAALPCLLFSRTSIPHQSLAEQLIVSRRSERLEKLYYRWVVITWIRKQRRINHNFALVQSYPQNVAAACRQKFDGKFAFCTLIEFHLALREIHHTMEVTKVKAMPFLEKRCLQKTRTATLQTLTNSNSPYLQSKYCYCLKPYKKFITTGLIAKNPRLKI
jgi:hypothetical protein